MKDFIKTYEKKNSNILRLIAEKNDLLMNPDYQRNGEIWTDDKRKLFIDSILNDYDIPKLYFHILSLEEQKKTGKKYAVIDGRQRIETILKFANNEFPLSDDFEYFQDRTINARGLYYSDVISKHPSLALDFQSFDLPIILVETDNLELIDDMFLRLNEAVPLNAAEKRNAIGGPLINSIKKIATTNLFKNKVKFKNRRYQHYEVAVRLLFIEHYLEHENKIYDTKKMFLDELAKMYKNRKNLKINAIESNALDIISNMELVFNDNDPLLAAQSIVPIYYLLFRDYYLGELDVDITRTALANFRDEVQRNKEIAGTDLSKANYEYLEFDRMSMQGTNDAGSIRERYRILKEYVLAH